MIKNYEYQKKCFEKLEASINKIPESMSEIKTIITAEEIYA
jgi:hypothetical protein